jgi:adenylate cyclase
MTEERAKRKLSGILSADAVGYSRLMQDDEALTIRTLEDSKELMTNLIIQYRGRWMHPATICWLSESWEPHPLIR